MKPNVSVVQEPIEQRMQQYSQAGDSLFALLETAGKDNAVREYVYQDGEFLDSAPVYAGTEFAYMARISPMLVQFTPQNPFVHWFVHQGHSAMGILFASSYSFPQVMLHLQGMLESHLPNLDFAMFRYYDPTVLFKYVFGVGEKERVRLLGPLSAIWWAQPQLKTAPPMWMELAACPPEGERPPLPPEPQPVITVTEEQIEAFEDLQYKDLARRLLQLAPAAK